MRRQRNAKIVATLGPASSSSDMIEMLYYAGADVFRLNFSHGTHEQHKKVYDHIRNLEKKVNKPIGILLDLQGPKLRVGEFNEGSIELKLGESFRIDLNDELGTKKRVCVPHTEIFSVLKKGLEILLVDGKIRLQVTEAGPDYAITEVITPGHLSSRQGINLPGVSLPLSSLTEKDREDLKFGLDLGVDWIALSFVQRPEDILVARGLVKSSVKILAKLEKPQALDYLEEIIDLSDAVMVARGDLGVEVPPEDVPSLQKRIITLCRKYGKPVVVATQMLDSMVHAPTPTRAEASDVATAVYDGVDAVMLSAESASGDYPSEAVAMMDRIIRRVEQDPEYRRLIDASRHDPMPTVPDAITSAARQVAHTIPITAIVTFTDTGSTTFRAARERPESQILALTPNIATARMLNLVWGATAIVTEDIENFNHMADVACQKSVQAGFANQGDRIIVVAGVPFGARGATNVMRVARVEPSAIAR